MLTPMLELLPLLPELPFVSLLILLVPGQAGLIVFGPIIIPLVPSLLPFNGGLGPLLTGESLM